MDLFEASDEKFGQKPVRMVALKPVPRISVAQMELGPWEAGERFEISRWVAEELVESGVAQLESEAEKLSLLDLQKAQIVETMQASRRLSTLPENFYPKLRRFLKTLKEAGSGNPEKRAEFEQALRLGMDILTSRLNKILLLASAPEQSEAAVRNLTWEERFLYERLYRTVEEWKASALKV
ncbi:hypothetical protein [Candidatus Hecatella orcuttiae]|uniref:hypothetical protein n=1 Tax=Candidatus Hecatella orcuttiae TaxID=1935119 RepID=UPI0028681BAC|nr:hypothetical protein [Candidatus Hecatella orcuttiae]